MSAVQPPTRKSARRQKNLWFERIMAIAATANLTLVLFDLSYVPWRDFWLKGTFQIPLINAVVKVPMPAQLTQWYDPIKGIEPHRETQQYLDTVNELEQQIAQQGTTSLQSPTVQKTLESLRSQSVSMVETNPFASANKSGTLEKIKNRMRERIYGSRRSRESSREAFERFWSPQYLTANNWQQEITWFDREIRPLIATNYYRSISESGDYTNNFGIIELPFVILFGLEFLARTFYISRRHKGLSWFDAMLWRWYDVLLLIPFWLFFPLLALSRIIPVSIRLHQAELVNMDRVLQQVTQGFVASIAEEITEVVVIQVINQIQGSIQRGDMARWLEHTSQQRSSYIDINNRNEVEEIANHLVQVTVKDVLPKIQPDLEALLNHNINGVLKQLPLYEGFQNIPGIGAIPKQMSERLVSEVTQTAYNTLKTALEDPVGAKLSSNLAQHFVEALSIEVQQQRTAKEIQVLLTDLLEEVKINYVQRLAQEDVEAILEQTRQLHQNRATAKLPGDRR
jgi:hypothetical protein